MITQKLIDDFLSQTPLAVAGVSRDPKKFGYACFRDLKKRGYTVIPVNPKIDSIDGEKCYPDIKSIPEKIGALLIVLHPEQTERITAEAFASGIKYVWMQKGAESQKAIDYCEANGINLVYGECILMFAQPVQSFHKFHRFFVKLFGKLPK
ncbi:MAG TPA: CoA-binding protein [Ignavibacteriaceae bacterium]|nr:CoA-binding protein [Ignavibacteriaceae bacterium]